VAHIVEAQPDFPFLVVSPQCPPMRHGRRTCS
jgi:hypothetical protein